MRVYFLRPKHLLRIEIYVLLEDRNEFYLVTIADDLIENTWCF